MQEHDANIRLMEDPDAVLPLALFQAPGTFTLTDRAWTEARDIAEALKASPSDLVVHFNWINLMRWQDKATGAWKELGPALCIGGFPRRKIPDGAICSFRGLDYIVSVSEKTLREQPGRLIEFSGQRGRFLFVANA